MTSRSNSVDRSGMPRIARNGLGEFKWGVKWYFYLPSSPKIVFTSFFLIFDLKALPPLYPSSHGFSPFSPLYLHLLPLQWRNTKNKHCSPPRELFGTPTNFVIPPSFKIRARMKVLGSCFAKEERCSTPRGLRGNVNIESIRRDFWVSRFCKVGFSIRAFEIC